jgi:oxalate decarboxylase
MTISRRMMMMAGAGLAAGATGETVLADASQPPFGPSPAPLSGNELPSFRFAMSEQEPRTLPGGWAKEATAKEFPVSEKLAGVLMQLAPGALREMHWHANGAEWGYVLEGNCRITTIDPDNRSEILDMGPGDVWYFPRGHGHSIEGIGNSDCRFVLIFDNGYFSEFGTFSVSDWLAHTPVEILAKNFGVAPEVFASFPTKEVYIAQGPVSAARPAEPAPGSLNAGPLTHRYHLLGARPDIFEGGMQRLVSELQFPIAETITGALLTIKPGGMRELHWHPNAAEWQYYVKGSGRMTVFGSHGRARTDEFAMGDVGYVPQGYGHFIENIGSDELEVLVALNSGIYRSISITAWFANTPAETLATNFGQSAAVFANFPKAERRMP